MLSVIFFSGVLLAITLPVQTADAENYIEYRLYTSNNPETYTICDPDNVSNCNIDVGLYFKFLIHGYGGDAEAIWVIACKDSYLRKQPYNVIAVDWSKLAKKFYYESVKYTRVVGNALGYFINQLVVEKNITYAQIHIIGHSLGAHVAGFTGKHAISIGKIIKRITGLDAAGPGFIGKPSNDRLDKHDAEVTDVIHGDDYFFGNYEHGLGKINFFPNNGTRYQPGCITKRKREILVLPKPGFFTCSHTRPTLFFNESINSNGFISKQCDSYQNYLDGNCDANPTTSMGENFDISLFGLFYLKTNAEFPFAQG